MVTVLGCLTTLFFIAFETTSGTTQSTSDTSTCQSYTTLWQSFLCPDRGSTETLAKRSVSSSGLQFLTNPRYTRFTDRQRRLQGSEFLGKRSLEGYCIGKRSISKVGSELLGKRSGSNAFYLGRCGENEWPLMGIRKRSRGYRSQGTEFLGKRAADSIIDGPELDQSDNHDYMYSLP